VIDWTEVGGVRRGRCQYAPGEDQYDEEFDHAHCRTLAEHQGE
jgi:hypothetical protein